MSSSINDQKPDSPPVEDIAINVATDNESRTVVKAPLSATIDVDMVGESRVPPLSTRSGDLDEENGGPTQDVNGEAPTQVRLESQADVPSSSAAAASLRFSAGGGVAAPGDVICHTFRVIEHIGKGGMGEVVRAEQLRAGTMHAIKVILPEFAQDPTLNELFIREAKALRGIRHDAVVAYEGMISDEFGGMFLVMEYVEGPKLKEVLRRGPLTAADVIQLLRRVGAGLAAAHDKEIVHRDISPDNIILPNTDVRAAKIIDFGIAKQSAASGATIIGNHFAGKYDYASPEQLGMFNSEVQAPSDIYSLGLVLAEAALGYKLDMASDPIQSRLHPPDISAVAEPLASVLRRMLAPKPSDRPQTMRDAIEICEQLCGVSSGGAGTVKAQNPITPPPPVLQQATGRGSKGKLPTLIAIGGLLAFAGGGYLILNDSAPVTSQKTAETAESPRPSSLPTASPQPVAISPPQSPTRDALNAPPTPTPTITKTQQRMSLDDARREIAAVAAGLPCAYIDIRQSEADNFTVKGFFAGAGDLAKSLADTFKQMDGAISLNPQIAAMPLPFCKILSLAPPPSLSGEPDSSSDIKISMNHPDRRYRSGENIKVEVTAGKQGGHLTVLYVDSQGVVINMAPIRAEFKRRDGTSATMVVDGKINAGETIVLGRNPTEKLLKPVYTADQPFGDEQHMIFAILTAEPLFSQEREIETVAETYLPILKSAILDNNKAMNPIIAKNVVFFTAQPKQ